MHLLSWCHIVCQPVVTGRAWDVGRAGRDWWSEVSSHWERGLFSPLINKVGQEQGNLHPSSVPSLSLCAPPSECRWGSHTWRWRVHSSLLQNPFPIRICIPCFMRFVWSICSKYETLCHVTDTHSEVEGRWEAHCCKVVMVQLTHPSLIKNRTSRHLGNQ